MRDLIIAQVIAILMLVCDTAANINGETIPAGGFYTNVWSNTADNITTLTFVAGGESGLGVGTKISISTWR